MIIIIPTFPEIFKPCTYPRVKEGYYPIGNFGTIRNNDTGKSFTPTSTNSSGYVHTSLCTEEEKKYLSVLLHRLVAWQFVDGYSVEDGRVFVNHKDSDRTNNYFENLEWTTVSENLIHAFRDGNKTPNIPDNSGPRPAIYGALNPNSKFPESFIREICEFLSIGHTTKEILKVYNATKSSNQQLYTLLMNLKHRKAWDSITREYEY